ncbi:MAG TPA: TlpA family protein disulfide reductase [Candidatus Marinimicrobia bacterium]|nr:TlpA family protein disulfide reductase [Candidatus Neomarinimicrobiota bacterium]HIB60381.1 TlpA family protein disulfide reductase [Candidatus Neomarinimicrobiota bacterium]HIM73262.1 TlpA family protein disulfide reductase [Candidatus Neomarinimicrobiota bacterium]
MNKLIIVLIIFLSFLNAVEPDERGYIVKVGDESPDFKMQLIDGKTITKKDLIGKVAVLQFTASWCSVCRKEMPHLEKDVWQKFKAKDFILIGVDRDEPLDVVQEFTKEIKVTYPMALDPGADIFALFAAREAGVTRNIVIDQTGKIVFLTRLFEEKEFKAMIAKIDALLNG